MTLDNFPTTRPSFTANFARSQQMPPQVTFSRASPGTVPSPGTVTGPNGISLSDYNTPRFAWKDGKCQGLLIEKNQLTYTLKPQLQMNNIWSAHWTTQELKFLVIMQKLLRWDNNCSKLCANAD